MYGGAENNRSALNDKTPPLLRHTLPTGARMGGGITGQDEPEYRDGIGCVENCSVEQMYKEGRLVWNNAFLLNETAGCGQYSIFSSPSMVWRT